MRTGRVRGVHCHVLQFEMHWLGTAAAGPDWLIEGSAEFVGFRAAASKGLFPADSIIGCMAREVADFKQQQPPGLQNLSAYEQQSVFSTTMGPLYSESLIGVDQLVANNLNSLVVYGNAIGAGTQYPSAFQTAFNMSLTAFYAQFPGYLAGLPTPPFTCGG